MGVYRKLTHEIRAHSNEVNGTGVNDIGLYCIGVYGP